MNGKPILGTLLGDAVGIGPEITVKLAASRLHDEYCRPVVIGDVRVLERGARICGLEIPAQVINKVEEAGWAKGMPVLDRRDADPRQIPFVNISIENGRACPNMLKITTELYQTGRVDGSCFAPLNKQAMIQAGCPFESEHYYMTHLLGHTGPFGKTNVLGGLWTTRTTSYIPVNKVNESLTVDTIMRAIRPANVSLRSPGIERPRPALVVPNPHCGEGGRYDREEIDVIVPAIERVREMGINASGPFPSDILFIRTFNGDFDGVVTTYHDQDRIALKLKGFDQGITIVGGLPASIVTCAHGMVYDVAGKGAVKTSVFENAVEMAVEVAIHLGGC